MATTVCTPSTAYRFQRYGPNESVPTATDSTTESSENPRARPGDFILTHGAGIIARLIRIGQRWVYHGKHKIYARWSHAAIFIDDEGNLIEAVGGGVQTRNISHYKGTEYIVGSLPPDTSDADRQQAVKFACYCLDEEYGLLTVVSIALCVFFGSKFHFGVNGQQICSGLVARCLERTGEIFTENEAWQIMPADLAKHFSKITPAGLVQPLLVPPPPDRGTPPNPNDGVQHFSKPGHRRR